MNPGFLGLTNKELMCVKKHMLTPKSRRCEWQDLHQRFVDRVENLIANDKE